MTDGSSRHPRHWNEMLAEFCALGGRVQNIAPGSEGSGAGLIAVNPGEPVLLRVPRNLLMRLDDLEFIDDEIRIREFANVPETERRFVERHQNVFSWAAGGRERAGAHIAALDTLPAEIRELLIADFGLGNLLRGDFAGRVQTHFLQSRAVWWRGDLVLAPVLELANRGTEGLRYERGMHLQIQGYARDVITVRYGVEDACSTFCGFGAADSQPLAFSLPAKVRIEDREIIIGRNLNEGLKRGEGRVPKTSTEGHSLSLSYLLLGHRNNPQQPRGTFRALLRESGLGNSDEAFDRIVRLNALKFIRLLRMMEVHDGEMISLLRKMARHQLEAMSWCIGSREPGPARQAIGQPQSLSPQ